MLEQGKINWLASYPKSGNTWFRAFLSNLLTNADKPVNINNISHSSIASSRQIFDEYSGIASSDLSKDEIERMRPFVYENLSETSKEMVYLKIHDAFIYTSEGNPMVSVKASNKALYIIRNPLDVAVSLSHHLATSIDIAVEKMCKPNYAFCYKTNFLPNQLEQRILSWSGHVLSWTTQTLIPVKTIRYEDMQSDTFNTFMAATNFLDIETSKEKVEKAISNSSFATLSQQEKESGFREKAPKAGSFFRQGKVNAWKNELPAKLADKIIHVHFDVMKQYNYLP